MEIVCMHFSYINHKDEEHSYVIIPMELACENYAGRSQKHYVVRGLCVMRDGLRRSVIRSFVIQNMRDLKEITLETR